MARRCGVMNKYDSRLRRCARSGLRAYESDMVHDHRRWYLPEWRDKTVRSRHGKALRNPK